MPRNSRSTPLATPNQKKGGLVRREAVAAKIRKTVAEVRREHYAGTLARRRVTFNYIVGTRADVTPATVKEDYHKESSDLVMDLLAEINGDAVPPVKVRRKPKPRARTFSDRLADMAREIEVVRYSKTVEVEAAEGRARKLSEEMDVLRRELDDVRLDRDRLKAELKRFRPLVVDRRPTISARRSAR